MLTKRSSAVVLFVFACLILCAGLAVHGASGDAAIAGASDVADNENGEQDGNDGGANGNDEIGDNENDEDPDEEADDDGEADDDEDDEDEDDEEDDEDDEDALILPPPVRAEYFQGFSAIYAAHSWQMRPVLRIMMGSTVYIQTDSGEIAAIVGHPTSFERHSFVSAVTGAGYIETGLAVYGFMQAARGALGGGLRVGYVSMQLYDPDLGLALIAITLDAPFVVSDFASPLDTFFGSVPMVDDYVQAVGAHGVQSGFVADIAAFVDVDFGGETLRLFNLIRTSIPSAAHDIGAALVFEGSAIGTLVYVNYEGAFFSAAYLYR